MKKWTFKIVNRWNLSRFGLSPILLGFNISYGGTYGGHKGALEIELTILGIGLMFYKFSNSLRW